MLNQLVQLLKHNPVSSTGWLCARMKINHNQLRAVCRDGQAKDKVKVQGRKWYPFSYVVEPEPEKTLSPDDRATNSATTICARLNSLMGQGSAM